jgi:ligand-binding sensor domain-containing protein/signal transduction histidine kinase
VVSSFLFITPIHAQPGAADLTFRNISTEDGLSQTTVLCMLQDRRGFMWIGTEDGLNRYDGHTFVTYRHNPLDSLSLSNSYIWALHEDREGMLWVGTYGGGLNRLDPGRNGFTRYLPDPADSTSISHDRVTSIIEDSLGSLWICTAGGGVCRFDRTTRHFVRVPRIASPPPANRRYDMFCMLTDRSGIIWIGTYFAGLISYDPSNGKMTVFQHDPANTSSISSNRITSMCEAGDGDLWVGTWGGGLNLLHRASSSFTCFKNDPRDSTFLPGDIVRAVALDRNNNLWVGTVGSGLARLNAATGRFTGFRHSPYLAGSLSDDLVCSILEDDGGVMWFGTSNGISLRSPYVQKFPVFRSEFMRPDGLHGENVFSMCQDSLGFIWIGTRDNGLNQFDPRSGRFRHYLNSPNDAFSLPNNNVTALMTDTRGDVWVGTYGGGVARFDRTHVRFVRYTADRAVPGRVLNLWISALAEDQHGNLWVGTWMEGVFVMNRSGKVLQRMMHNRLDSTSIPENDIRCIVRDRAGYFWVGTAHGGLGRTDSLRKIFKRFRFNPADPGSLSSDYVQSVCEDSRGDLWIGTLGGGLNRMDRRTGQCTHFNEQHGLPNNVVYGILEDRFGKLWLSTNNGITCFDPVRSTFENYSRHDGLQSDEFNFSAYTYGPDGALYFGGVKGFNIIVPGSIMRNPYAPRIAVTGFNVFNAPLSLDSAFSVADVIVLDYTRNFFSLEYASLDYSLPTRNSYAYMLEGLDKSWVQAGTRRLASYTNIDPGRYIFHVIGTNNDGVWNRTGTSIAIIITPPFWQTTWFRILSLLGLLIIITIAYRLRVASILKVERMRLSIASDLHDDIGSSLASIAVIADLVRNRMTVPPAASSHLFDISRAARTTSDALRDIVWFINPEHDFSSDIVDHLQAIASKLLAGVEYTFRRDDQGPSVRLPMTFRRDVLLLYKEILSNIVRHAEASHVDIRVCVDGGRLRLSVTDNGKGFDASLPSNGNGLSTMRRRAQQLGGTIDISSNPLKGTAVSLEAKIP